MEHAQQVADVAPELLIGAAVDVVVAGLRTRSSASCSASRTRSASWSCSPAINVVVWIIESVTDYVAATLWRSLAQAVEHDLRMDTYAHVQELEVAWFEDHAAAG